jgi:hypothetical protein
MTQDQGDAMTEQDPPVVYAATSDSAAAAEADLDANAQLHAAWA